MELKIPIEGPERFLFMLKLLQTFSPFNQLNNRERQVFSELLYVDYELRQLSERRRNALVFDYDTRREIMEKYKFSSSSLYNLIHSLKKKGFLGEHVIKVKLEYPQEIKFAFRDASSSD